MVTKGGASAGMPGATLAAGLLGKPSMLADPIQLPAPPLPVADKVDE